MIGTLPGVVVDDDMAPVGSIETSPGVVVKTESVTSVVAVAGSERLRVPVDPVAVDSMLAAL